MKTLVGDFVTAFLMGFVLPGLLLGAAVFCYAQEPSVEEAGQEETLPAEELPGNLVRIHRDGTVLVWDLDTYLVGVLLAEMPVDFEQEALKAQAVAARTYARKAFVQGGKHGDGSVCLEAACCQAYLAPEDYLLRGGTVYGVQRAENAVKDTAGQVLCYGDQLIEATYFSCSGGQTEAAAAVWGTEYPYLQSVSSPGEESAAYYRDVLTLSPEEFAGYLDICPEGDPETWISMTEYTQGGSVRIMMIDGILFTGTQLRRELELPSAAFDVEIVEEKFQITTRGHGHRVGMSQYGAEAMACAGSSYQDILFHYYPGTTLHRLDPDLWIP